MHENSILYFLNHLISAVLRLLPLLSSPINPGLQWEIRWKIYGRANRASLIIHSSNFTGHLVSGCRVISSLATKTQPLGAPAFCLTFGRKDPLKIISWFGKQGQQKYFLWNLNTCLGYSLKVCVVSVSAQVCLFGAGLPPVCCWLSPGKLEWGGAPLLRGKGISHTSTGVAEICRHRIARFSRQVT